jgi:hypothetical protein
MWLREFRDCQSDDPEGVEQMLEIPGIPLPFRIKTISLEVLDLEFKALDEII